MQTPGQKRKLTVPIWLHHGGRKPCWEVVIKVHSNLDFAGLYFCLPTNIKSDVWKEIPLLTGLHVTLTLFGSHM